MHTTKAKVMSCLLAAALPISAPTVSADIVGARFSGTISAVYENLGELPISSTDVLHGHLVIDTSTTSRTNPGAPYADYAVSSGAQISVYIGGKEFRKPLDFINVTNDRATYTSDSVMYLDRFFVSGGNANLPSSDLMQLWMDESHMNVIPTLLSSLSIPVPLDLDVSLTNGASAWLVYAPEIQVAGSLLSFEPFDPPVMLQELLADATAARLSKGLINKIKLARTYHEAGDAEAASAVLADFVVSVRNMITPKKPRISAVVGSRLIADAEAIRSAVQFM